MKFRWKIFLLCIVIYISSLTVIAYVVTESSYANTLRSEIQRSLKEQSNIYSSATIYMLSNIQNSSKEIDIKKYSSYLVEIFSNQETHLEVFSNNKELLSSNFTKAQDIERKELDTALENGTNYILRNIKGKEYIFISEVIKIESQQIILTMVKDITYVIEHRRFMYRMFVNAGLIGLAAVAIVTGIMSKVVIRPIQKLSSAAQNIASGSYNQRVEETSKDEVGALARQFNVMAQEVENKIRLLNDEGERKQRFVDNLTHELRTPLTSIIGYGEIMEGMIQYDEKLFKKSIGYINSEGKRMLKMINRLMQMTLLRTNPSVLEKSSVGPLLKEIADIVSIKAEKSNISIKLDIQDIKINIDIDLIKEAIINLIDNAINASKEGDIITLGSRIENHRHYVFVEDQGIGMNKEEIQKITEPFYRVDKSRSRKNGGYGLGLAITKEIINMHRAYMDIESTPGQGTTVKIVFLN